MGIFKSEPALPGRGAEWDSTARFPWSQWRPSPQDRRWRPPVVSRKERGKGDGSLSSKKFNKKQVTRIETFFVKYIFFFERQLEISWVKNEETQRTLTLSSLIDQRPFRVGDIWKKIGNPLVLQEGTGIHRFFSLPKVGPSSFGRLDVSFPSKTSEGFQGAKSVDG